MLRYMTAGESHGPQLTAILEGMPAGLSLSADMINCDLARRQQGYGRGGRMQIEKDCAEILSGVRNGKTLGSPITVQIRNRDWANWEEIMTPALLSSHVNNPVTRPRPGHADLAGAMKYNHQDVRNILERSSARETAVRVAIGAVARTFLAEFGIIVAGFVMELGNVRSEKPTLPLAELRESIRASLFSTFDPAAEERMRNLVDSAKAEGDSVGGVVEIHVSGCPIGLGSHVHWDRKLDARLAFAVMSIQAIKGVEIGLGFDAARSLGSQVHDEIHYDAGRLTMGEMSGFYRKTNNAGGIEGGMSNGEDIVIRAAMKPIPTLYKPLHTVDILTKETHEASVERSDVCAVPAAAVVAEAVVAIEIATAFLEKFGGDCLTEIRRNYDSYLDYLRNF